MRLTCYLLLGVAGCRAFCPSPLRARLAPGRAARRALQLEAESQGSGDSGDSEADADADFMSDELLSAGLDSRLEKSGGKVGLALSTPVTKAVSSVATGAKRAQASLNAKPDPGRDLLDVDGWKLTVGALALVVALSVASFAFNAPPSTAAQPYQTGGVVDKFTSDGSELGFGTRR